MKPRCSILLVSTLVLSGLKGRSQEPTGRLFDNPQRVQGWMGQNHVPALGIGLIREGQLQEIRLYGELTKGVPAPYNALFKVASLTKPVVTMVTLQLVSRGAWNLDEPLSHYWVDPDIAADPRHQKLTTRLVLSHQTGFKNCRYLNANGKLTIDTDPGTRFGYSGEGFEYLRKALENKFGKSLEQLSDSLLFQPLGMKDTHYQWSAATEESRFAHWFDSIGREHSQDFHKTRVNAADDLLTTLEDYGKFAVHIIKGGGLDSSVYHQMIRPHVPTKGGQ